MLRAAGELADGVITVFAGPKALESLIVPTVTAAASVAPRIVVGANVSVSDDPETARRWLVELMPQFGRFPSYRSVLDLDGRASPADSLVVGDEKAVERHLRDLFDAGATEVIATPFGPPNALARTTALLSALID